MAGEPDETRVREPGILADRPDGAAARRATARPSRLWLVAIAALGLTGVAAFGLAPDTAVDAAIAFGSMHGNCTSPATG